MSRGFTSVLLPFSQCPASQLRPDIGRYESRCGASFRRERRFCHRRAVVVVAVAVSIPPISFLSRRRLSATTPSRLFSSFSFLLPSPTSAFNLGKRRTRRMTGSFFPFIEIRPIKVRCRAADGMIGSKKKMGWKRKNGSRLDSSARCNECAERCACTRVVETLLSRER